MRTKTLVPFHDASLLADGGAGPLPRWWPQRYRGNPAVYGGHATIFALAYALAYVARFEGDITPRIANFYLATLPLAVGVQMAAGAAFSLFRGPFRYFSTRDAACATAACTLASLALLLLRGSVDSFAISRGVILSHWAFSVIFLLGARLALRAYREGVVTALLPGGQKARRLTIICGAGDGGEQLLRETLAHPEHGLEVVGFVDDDPNKVGMRIHRVPILGPCSELASHAERLHASLVLVAMPRASGAQRRRVVSLAQGARLECKTLPALDDIVRGTATVSQIRPVKIDDLLGRPPVQTDLNRIAAGLRDRCVLVTGAAGSIGSELCRQIAMFGVSRLVLFDRNETGLFWLEKELLDAGASAETIVVALGDVTDSGRVREVLDAHKPATIFHAAAYKHVPLVELSPMEALKNNVLGTMVVADAAAASGIGSFVLISTDKAVNPANFMGASKRLAELYIQRMARTEAGGTRFASVRFGNVLGSVGSVVPIFMRQIERGGPVTVTHREMKRYFMTIREAAQLVLQAADLGIGGEVFVLDMGEQVKIVDLAHLLIQLSGLVPEHDIEVVETGIRPGEKLEEALCGSGETLIPSSHPRIMIVREQGQDDAAFDWEKIRGGEIRAEATRLLSRAREGEGTVTRSLATDRTAFTVTSEEQAA
jgi:FlaA1/EpsC-like NDP-sugar epimerase